ncbi:MAG: BLUF domain-containing protein [Pseudomonadales bacterium]|jgi:hypothetical protein|nr:BLUF domain-containing protein [Pseudomonadales bacterium]
MRWPQSLLDREAGFAPEGPGAPRTGRWARARSQGSLLGLCYASRAARHLEADDLATLVHQAREKNLAREITGCLVYGAGLVIQMLEGPPRNVLELFRQIRTDARHLDVHTICAGPIHGRAFEGAPLECHDLDLGTFEHFETLRDELSILYYSLEADWAEVLAFVEAVRNPLEAGESVMAIA